MNTTSSYREHMKNSLHRAQYVLAWQVDMCQRVSAAGSSSCDDVDALVSDVAPVAEVQPGQWGQVFDDAAEGVVSDVQTSQTQLVQITQLTSAVPPTVQPPDQTVVEILL